MLQTLSPKSTPTDFQSTMQQPTETATTSLATTDSQATTIANPTEKETTLAIVSSSRIAQLQDVSIRFAQVTETGPTDKPSLDAPQPSLQTAMEETVAPTTIATSQLQTQDLLMLATELQSTLPQSVTMVTDVPSTCATPQTLQDHLLAITISSQSHTSSNTSAPRPHLAVSLAVSQTLVSTLQSTV